MCVIGSDPADGGDEGTGYGSSYSAILFGTAAVGAVALAVGLGGTFVALTGGGDGPSPAGLDGFVCESFDGDPDVTRQSTYTVERQVVSPAEVSSFDGTVRKANVSIVLETAGPLLEAWATAPTGRPIGVETRGDQVRIDRTTTAPFRLWVDSVSEDGTVTRMQLDLCPAEAA